MLFLKTFSDFAINTTTWQRIDSYNLFDTDSSIASKFRTFVEKVRLC